MSDPDYNLSDWVPGKVIVKENPHIWTDYAIKVEGANRELNGMKEARAVMLFKHKLLFHRRRLAQWVEETYSQRA